MIYVLSGGTSLYAVIAVTYPSGSICTCGGKAAKDTSGFALFNVKAGTYTVECHTSDNSKSKSTSVTVAESDKGKSIGVPLSYNLMLYDAGDQFAEVTGGWSYTGANSPVFNANNIVVEPTVSNGTCVLTTANKIDLTGIKTLHFYLKCDTTGSLSNGGNCQAVGANTSNAIRVDNNRMTADVKVPTTADYKDYTVDVSALSGSYYILVATLSVERLWYAKLTVSKIWGEYA